MESGMSEAEAKAAADKRIKIEKVLAVTAGVTVGACVAYYAKNRWTQTRCDQILKAGTKFHNLDSASNERLGEHLYVNYRKDDTDFFRGQFALGKLKKSGHVFDYELTAERDIKIPSINTRKNVFKELYDKDPEFAKVFREHSDIKKDSVSAKNVYKRMWSSMGDKDDPEFNVAKRKYFEALKQKGYDAIVDEWDTKAYVYRSEAPLILLDTSSKSFGNRTIRELTERDILIAQANSKSWIRKRNFMNATAGSFHNNNFKETEKRLAKYAAKSAKNSEYIDKAIKALTDNDSEALKRLDIDLKKIAYDTGGTRMVRAGKIMSKNSNLTTNDVVEAYLKVLEREAAEEWMKAVGFYGGVYGVSAAATTASNNRKVEKYIAEHPNTKLSNKEILKMLNK